MTSDNTTPSQRVLVLMPTRVDAERTAQLLSEAQIAWTTCSELADVCRELRVGAGALLLTDEAILGDSTGQLAEAMREQPAWSAPPVLVLAREGASAHLQNSASETLRSLTIIERPVHMQTLLSMVRAALRARRHQYEIRDAMLTHERQAAELGARDESLRFALNAGGLGAWELDLASNEVTCSELWRVHYGYDAHHVLTYDSLIGSTHPEDRAAVRTAIQRCLDAGSDLDIEQRVCWPNGDVRWLMVRGRAAQDESGRPVRLAGVTLDITERKRLDEALEHSQSELAQQADQLRNADRLKDDFLATLAHELRNPLAPIRTGLDLLAGSPPADVGAHTQRVMQRQLKHMVRLIDDLLDVSRITQGRLDLKRERITLTSAIEAALEATQPFIQRWQHTLRVTRPDQLMWLDADPTRIAQVISNLLHNASKYTAPGGEIELRARRDGEYAVIEVSDNGIGIPADRIEDVFVLFKQVNRSLDRSQGGLGIGLALVRRLVEMHGGSVRAESAGAGRGSTFSVRLPLAEQRTEQVTPTSELAHHSTHKRILVVDDNDDAAELLSLMLEQAGHATRVAHDGPSAIITAAAYAPEIVFLDIGLPGMSGYDVARKLRLDPRFENTRLIALTGWGTLEDRRKAEAAGFDVHLTKPIDASALQGALDRVARDKR